MGSPGLIYKLDFTSPRWPDRRANILRLLWLNRDPLKNPILKSFLNIRPRWFSRLPRCFSHLSWVMVFVRGCAPPAYRALSKVPNINRPANTNLMTKIFALPATLWRHASSSVPVYSSCLDSLRQSWLHNPSWRLTNYNFYWVSV